MGHLIEGEDYYFEGPLMVFTEKYHLKRKQCCGSGCRHCPYDPKWTKWTRDARETPPDSGQENVPDLPQQVQK